MNTEKDTVQKTTPEERFFGVSHEVDLDATPDKEEETKVEVETVDDEESEPQEAAEKSEKDEHKDEVEEYSERVQKRIDKLTWKAKDAERKLKAAQAERDEAFRATQNLYGQNQQYQQIIQQGEGILVQRMKEAATAALASAEAKLRAAHEEGDTDAIIAAQREIIKAQGQSDEADRAENDYRFRQSQPKPRPQQQYPQQPQVRQPEPEVAEWAEKNPWFMSNEHRDMTAVALAEHERLVVDEKIPPNSPEYYEKIDAKIRQIFPTYFASNTGSETSATAPVNTVVAPADRTAPTSKTRKVKLTPSALKLAKKLGLTPEQYANQVLKDRGLL
jgi:hypothetical protein